MNFRFSLRAESEAEKKRDWWQKNRPVAADLFDDELAAALDAITARRRSGQSTRRAAAS